MSKIHPYIVGICGGSGSGKTYFLNRLVESLGEDDLTLVSQDNYYKPREEQPRDSEGLINFDHPNSINLQNLTQDIQRIINGESFELLEYTFNNPNVTPKVFQIEPRPIIIIEGLFIYHLPELANLIDLKIFVEAAEYNRLIRRLRRDTTERGYSYESIMRDYEKFVAPMYKKYVEPTKKICDLIVPNHTHMDNALLAIIHHLRQMAKERKPN